MHDQPLFSIGTWHHWCTSRRLVSLPLNRTPRCMVAKAYSVHMLDFRVTDQAIGGAIQIYSSTLTMESCSIVGSTSIDGGFLYLIAGSVSISSCVLSNSSAEIGVRHQRWGVGWLDVIHATSEGGPSQHMSVIFSRTVGIAVIVHCKWCLLVSSQGAFFVRSGTLKVQRSTIVFSSASQVRMTHQRTLASLHRP